MNLDDVEAYIAVIRHQSISQAAVHLSVTQSAISKRIQSLERALNLRLLDRNVKPPVPTQVGLKVYEHCLDIMRAVDGLRTFASGNTQLASGLRLGMTQAVCDLVLADILRLQRRNWPELALRTTTGWANYIIDELSSQRLDAGIVLMPAHKIFPRNVIARPLGQVEMAVIAPSGFGDRAQYRLATLHQVGWILNPDGCGFRAELQRALSQQNLPLQVNLDTFARETQLQMVAEGMGLGLVPRPFVEASHWRDRLQTLTLTDFALGAELWLCHAPLSARLESVIEAFGDIAAQAFRKIAAPAPVPSMP